MAIDPYEGVDPAAKSLLFQLQERSPEQLQRDKQYRDRLFDKISNAVPRASHEERFAYAMVTEKVSRMHLEEMATRKPKPPLKQMDEIRQGLIQALVEQGRLQDAMKEVPLLRLAKDRNRIGKELTVLMEATLAPDDQFCNCVGQEIAEGIHLPAHWNRGKVYSLHHKGWVYHIVCTVNTKHQNITPKIPQHLNLLNQAKSLAGEGASFEAVAGHAHRMHEEWKQANKVKQSGKTSI